MSNAHGRTVINLFSTKSNIGVRAIHIPNESCPWSLPKNAFLMRMVPFAFLGAKNNSMERISVVRNTYHMQRLIPGSSRYETLVIGLMADLTGTRVQKTWTIRFICSETGKVCSHLNGHKTWLRADLGPDQCAHLNVTDKRDQLSPRCGSRNYRSRSSLRADLTSEFSSTDQFWKQYTHSKYFGAQGRNN